MSLASPILCTVTRSHGLRAVLGMEAMATYILWSRIWARHIVTEPHPVMSAHACFYSWSLLFILLLKRLFGEIFALATAIAREGPGSTPVCSFWSTGEGLLGVHSSSSRPGSLLVFRASKLSLGQLPQSASKAFLQGEARPAQRTKEQGLFPPLLPSYFFLPALLLVHGTPCYGASACDDGAEPRVRYPRKPERVVFTLLFLTLAGP